MGNIEHKAEYTFGEEVANSVSHGIGIVLPLTALIVLTHYCSRYGDAWHWTAAIIFGFCLLLCYTSSTLYHSLPGGRGKEILRTCDHASIYLLIAGTYTPFTLISLRGPWGWSLFGTIWGLALLGVGLKLRWPGKLEKLSLLLYLLMGWSVLVALQPMLTRVDPAGLWLLLAGGLAYSGGVIFYLLDRLPYNHLIWHLFVLSGSCLHFLSILLYVLPGA